MRVLKPSHDIWPYFDKRGHICCHAVMKRSEYARQAGVSYKTAWRWWHAGQLAAYQAASGTLIGRETIPTARRPLDVQQVAVDARVSAAENRPNLASQAQRWVAYCAAKGSPVHQVVKEIGSGVNESRPPFLKLLVDPAITVIVVEQKDRGTRFGFRLDSALATRCWNGKGDALKCSTWPTMGARIWWPIASPASPRSARVCRGSAERSAGPQRW
jgi:predicted site-specific integrase-resolvase